MTDDETTHTGPEAGGADARRSPVDDVRDATGRVLSRAATVAEAVVGAADELVGTVRPAAGHLVASTRRIASGRARRLRKRAVVRRAQPLPNLYERHPEARNAPVLDLGLQTIPIEEIVGTAVEGPAQRGLDFRPLPAFRSHNWEARWQRILGATERLENLPPIDVLRTAEGCWVTDGHNRVAAARTVGQLELDAVVRAVLLPGEPPPRPSGQLAPVLAEAAQLEAAGRGLLTPGTTIRRVPRAPGPGGRSPDHGGTGPEPEGDPESRA